MGGSGSGQYYRWSKKDTVESQHRVDIRFMRQRGVLKRGYTGSFTWSMHERETGSVGFWVIDSRMVLMYRYRARGGEWEDVTQTVHFAYTSCHYGGVRTWFRCPGCGRRVASLYGPGREFLCRHCCGLTYESRQESLMFRLQSKAQKIRQGLGGSGSLNGPFPGKPKGMHWCTYERLYREAEEADRQSWFAIGDWMARQDETAARRLKQR